MSNISSHHRRTPWISALDFFRGTAEQCYAHPGSIVGAGSLHTGQVDSPATVAAWAAAGVGAVGNNLVTDFEARPSASPNLRRPLPPAGATSTPTKSFHFRN